VTLKALWPSHNSEVNPVYSKQSTFTLHRHVVIEKKKKNLAIYIPITAAKWVNRLLYNPDQKKKKKDLKPKVSAFVHAKVNSLTFNLVIFVLCILDGSQV
jgi:hypothetical protein